MSVLWSLLKKIQLPWHWMVTIHIWGMSRWETVLGKTGCTLFAFPRRTFINCNLCDFPSCSLWRHTTQRRYKFGWKTIQTELLHTIKLLNWLGKLTWNRPQQLSLQTDSGKQTSFPATVTYLMNMILEESQRNIMSCLFEISVPCPRIEEGPPNTSGTNPQTLTNSHSPCLRKHYLLLFCPLTLALFQIPLAGNKSSQQNMRIPGKGLLLFWRVRLTKTNLKKTERGKRLDIRGNLPLKYGCRRRDGPVLMTKMFQSFVVNVRWRQSSSLVPEDCEKPSLIESDE